MHSSKYSEFTGASYEDVSIVPAQSSLTIDDIQTKTRIADRFYLNIPILSSALDIVTEHDMAAAIARCGGLGVIHNNMPIGHQVEEVRKVKRLETKIIEKPIVVSAETPLAEALDLMRNFNISGLPVIDMEHKLAGILTNRDVRFASDLNQPVSSRMTTENLITVSKDIEPDAARKLMFEHRIEKLIIVDEQGKCAGLLTVKDLEQMKNNPDATRDSKGRLKVAAAVGIGKDGYDRAQALADAEADIIIVDAVNGHHQDVLTVVSKISQLQSSKIKVIAGNVVTGDGARALIDCGAHAIKVGCKGRHSGVGVPALSAIMDVSDACSINSTPVIVDGGIFTADDVAKAIAAGADAVMLSHPLAGTDEAPGTIVYETRNTYKVREGARDKELRRPSYKGKTSQVIETLIDGLKQSMVESASQTIEDLKYNTKFVRHHFMNAQDNEYAPD